MTETLVILTETALVESDRAVIAGLVQDQDYNAIILTPADTERHLLMDFVERLSLLEIREAFRGLGDSTVDKPKERSKAQELLQTSVSTLTGLFGSISSEVVDEPEAVSALVAAVRESNARQAVVFSEPHSVLDTFHADIATRAQDELQLPVLHVYAGSGFIGES